MIRRDSLYDTEGALVVSRTIHHNQYTFEVSLNDQKDAYAVTTLREGSHVTTVRGVPVDVATARASELAEHILTEV